MKTWRECYFERRQLKSDKWDHYFEIYDRYFERRRCKAAPVYLEIGCQNGGSLETARCYFGDQAKIFGIDNEPSCAALNEMPFVSRVFIGDQSDPTFLNSVATETGPLDIVLDDGSHQAHDQIVSFLTLFPALATDGVTTGIDRKARVGAIAAGPAHYRSHPVILFLQTLRQLLELLNGEQRLAVDLPVHRHIERNFCGRNQITDVRL
jgi:hypothetical protein